MQLKKKINPKRKSMASCSTKWEQKDVISTNLLVFLFSSRLVRFLFRLPWYPELFYPFYMFTLSFLCVNYIQTNWPSAISPPIYHLVPIYPYMMGFQLFKDVLCNEPFFDNLGNETKTFKTFCLVFKRMIITTLII